MRTLHSEESAFASCMTGCHTEYMNAEHESHFRQILERWRAQLLSGASETLTNMRESHEVLSDEADLASQEEDFRLSLRARDRDRKLIRKIEQSLEALKTGDYGYCDDCGEEIGVKRLEARPTATKCIECKTVAEIKERQMAE